jgi:FdhE protein
MPYAALPQVPAAARRAAAEVRWDAITAARPDLATAVALQRRLIGLVLDLLERFEHAPPARLSLPPRYVTTKLAAGIPALSGEPIQMPSEVVGPTVRALATALDEAGGGEATAALRAAIDGDRLDLPVLLVLALRRDQATLRSVATAAGVGHDLLWLVTDLAVGPLASVLLDRVFGTVEPHSPLAGALDAWTRGYCPLCGSWPAIGETVGGVGRLRCALCAAAWATSRPGCVYCGEAGERFQSLVPDGGQPGRQVDVCGACRGYLKHVEAPVAAPFPLLALTDLESMDLDIVALQRGFARPALKRFGRR